MNDRLIQVAMNELAAADATGVPVGTVAGYPDAMFEVIGEWRGYLNVRHLETQTTVKVKPEDFTPEARA